MTTFGSDYVFPFGRLVGQGLMSLYIRRRRAARRKHHQRNVTVISSGSNLSCALRKRLGLACNRIEKLRLRPQAATIGRSSKGNFANGAILICFRHRPAHQQGNATERQPGCTKTHESGDETRDAQARK